jgi:hypothetical protein
MDGCAGDNAQWNSDAGFADLTAALQQALQARGYLASGATTGPYLLTVTLQRTFPAAPRDAQKLHTENLAGIRQNAA